MPNRPVHWTHDKLSRIQVLYLAICIFCAVAVGVVGYIAVSTTTDVSHQQHQIHHQQVKTNELARKNHQLAKRTDKRLDQAYAALCNFTGDLHSRVTQTQKFLRHPEDFPGFADPKTVALIRSQVVGQQATLASLSGLRCDREP